MTEGGYAYAFKFEYKRQLPQWMFLCLQIVLYHDNAIKQDPFYGIRLELLEHLLIVLISHLVIKLVPQIKT
jgi:hypothetical protein